MIDYIVTLVGGRRGRRTRSVSRSDRIKERRDGRARDATASREVSPAAPATVLGEGIYPPLERASGEVRNRKKVAPDLVIDFGVRVVCVTNFLSAPPVLRFLTQSIPRPPLESSRQGESRSAWYFCKIYF